MTDVKLALGTMLFGTRTDEKTSFALLDQFVDAGGTRIDTANCYAFWADPSGFGGQSEELIGAWLASRPGMRERVVISTKVGAEPLVAGEWPRSAEGLSASAIKAGVQGSLRRLGIDHIDLYWAHMEDRTVALEETVGAFGELVAAGMVGAVGCSNHPTWRVERAREIAARAGVAGYSALQLRHSYLRPMPGAPVPDQSHPLSWVTDETLDYVRSNPLELWVYKALINGGYSRQDKPLRPAFRHLANERRQAVLSRVASDLGVDVNEVVLAWLAGGEPVAIPIVGVSGPQQLEQALAGVALKLDGEHRAMLDNAWNVAPTE